MRKHIGKPSPLGQQIKVACISAGLSHEELAQRLGMLSTQLSNIIYGRGHLSLERAVLLRQATGMSLDELTKDM